MQGKVIYSIYLHINAHKGLYHKSTFLCWYFFLFIEFLIKLAKISNVTLCLMKLIIVPDNDKLLFCLSYINMNRNCRAERYQTVLGSKNNQTSITPRLFFLRKMSDMGSSTASCFTMYLMNKTYLQFYVFYF